jgi:hypothetical protein
MPSPTDADPDEILGVLTPIVEALGAAMVSADAARSGDIPVQWRGRTIGHVRVGELHGALDRLVTGAERELGVSLTDMSRAEKQAVVRRLDEQGAFLLRGAVEEVAALMGVSRVTLYSYLNAIEGGRRP